MACFGLCLLREFGGLFLKPGIGGGLLREPQRFEQGGRKLRSIASTEHPLCNPDYCVGGLLLHRWIREIRSYELDRFRSVEITHRAEEEKDPSPRELYDYKDNEV